MPRKAGTSRRHVPQRTCIGCRQTGSKRDLIRLVRTAHGIQVEGTERLHGRGAYLHPRQECWEKGIQASLPNALRTTISAEEKQELLDQVMKLPGYHDHSPAS